MVKVREYTHKNDKQHAASLVPLLLDNMIALITIKFSIKLGGCSSSGTEHELLAHSIVPLSFNMW
jgi:hypothetical protein